MHLRFEIAILNLRVVIVSGASKCEGVAASASSVFKLIFKFARFCLMSKRDVPASFASEGSFLYACISSINAVLEISVERVLA